MHVLVAYASSKDSVETVQTQGLWGGGFRGRERLCRMDNHTIVLVYVLIAYANSKGSVEALQAQGLWGGVGGGLGRLVGWTTICRLSWSICQISC